MLGAAVKAAKEAAVKAAKGAVGAITGLLPVAELDTRPPLFIPDLPKKKQNQEEVWARFEQLRSEAKAVPFFTIEEDIFALPSLVKGKRVSLIPEDMQKLYLRSPRLQKEMNEISQAWCLLECDPTAMISYAEHQKLPPEALKIMGALRTWKQNPGDEPEVPFIKFILRGPDFHHLIKPFCGTSGVVEINKQAFLMQYLEITGFFGIAKSLFPHGNEAGEDFDIIVVTEQPCLHMHPADERALAGLSEKPLDIIMCTVKDGAVDWSSTGRLITSFLLSLQGADPNLTLTYRQLGVLLGLRMEQIHQKIGRIDPVGSVTRVLMNDNPKKTRHDADAEAKLILELTNLGGLTIEKRDVVLRAMVDVIKQDLSSTSPPAKGKKSDVKAETAEAKLQREQDEEAEVLRRKQSATEALLQMFKQLAHILAIERKEYSSDTGALAEAAVSGCSEVTRLTVRKLLKHEVPDDEEGIDSVLKFVCEKVGNLPLPEPAPAAPDVPEAPLVEENPRVAALFATQLAANAEAVEAAEAPDAEKEAAFQSMIAKFLYEAAIRNLPLAQNKYDVLMQRVNTAQSKKTNAELRPEPKRKEGEGDDAFSKREQLRLKEIESATAQYQKLLEELVDAEAKLVQARAKAQEASASRGE